MANQRRADPLRRAWPIFVLAVLFGLGALFPFVMQAYRDVRITWFYRPATCYVISSRIYDTAARRSYSSGEDSSSHPEFIYQLQVDGRPYTAVGFDNMGGRTAHPGETSSFRSGQSYPCWYDPWNPEQAVLRKQVHAPFYLGLAIPALFLLVGGSMLARSLRTVPSPTLAGRVEGDALAVRLSPELTGGRAVGCIGALAIAWTAGVVVLLVHLIRSDQLFSDNPALLALAAVGIDVFLVYQLVRAVRGLGIPEPVVEIEREPVAPGGRARILVRQGGPARFDPFKVWVLCEEQKNGETRQHHKRLLVERKPLDVTAADPLSASATLEIPPDAQPSLRELQTVITWKIVVERRARFGGADREFVFRVLSESVAQPTA